MVTNPTNRTGKHWKEKVEKSIHGPKLIVKYQVSTSCLTLAIHLVLYGQPLLHLTIQTSIKALNLAVLVIVLHFTCSYSQTILCKFSEYLVQNVLVYYENLSLEISHSMSAVVQESCQYYGNMQFLLYTFVELI